MSMRTPTECLVAGTHPLIFLFFPWNGGLPVSKDFWVSNPLPSPKNHLWTIGGVWEHLPVYNILILNQKVMSLHVWIWFCHKAAIKQIPFGVAFYLSSALKKKKKNVFISWHSLPLQSCTQSSLDPIYWALGPVGPGWPFPGGDYSASSRIKSLE